jgi:hypothetical protein
MTPETIIAAATRLGATVLRAPGADVIVLSHAEPSKDAMVPLHECARLACTSVRVVRDAIRKGELPAYGKERDRSVRHADLAGWIETRRLPITKGPDDADVERWMKRQTATRGKRARR